MYKCTLIVLFGFTTVLVLQAALTGYDIPDKYWISDEPANFYEAAVICKQGGMDLASIDSVEEEEALDRLLMSYRRYEPVNGLWLSGMRTIHKENASFFWLSTGAKMEYERWAVGQPDMWNDMEWCVQWTVYDETYYVENGNKLQTGWNDYPCEYPIKFICEIN